MNWHPNDILAALDQCCESFTFPMLDNGYVYPAATRLSPYRSAEDWAMVIEVFGFSPRAGLPDIHVHTFGSRLRRARSDSDFTTRQAHEAYLVNNAHNESTFVYPIEDGDWLSDEDAEQLAQGPHEVWVRGTSMATPPVAGYAAADIALQDPPNVFVFEFCRFLAASARHLVLATEDERRASVPPELVQVMQLEAWHHPDLVKGERPSTTATFQALAKVLAHGASSHWPPTGKPNTHWDNWPEAGTL